MRKLVSKYPLFFIGASILIITTLIAAAAPLIAPYSPYDQSILNRLAPSSPEHLLGTDEFGRDVLSRLIYGSRITLIVGFSVALVSSILGMVIGLTSGYYLGAVDAILMRLTEAMMAVPGILLAIGILAVAGPGTTSIAVALTIVYTPRMARVARSAVLSLREKEYVESARAAGASNGRIIWKYLLPNVVGPPLVQGTITFAYAVLAEAGLSFLGLGAPAPAPSWGNVVADGKAFLYNAPWVSVFGGLAISILVLAINLLGDGLRDILDPRT